MPQALCVTTAVALSVPSSPMARSNAIGWVSADERQVALHAIRRPPVAVCTRVERNVMSWRLRTSSSMVWWMFADVVVAEGLHPARALCTRSEVGSAVSSMLVLPASSPTSSVASQEVTWITRSCPAFAAAPARPVRTERVALSGPSRWVPD